MTAGRRAAGIAGLIATVVMAAPRPAAAERELVAHHARDVPITLGLVGLWVVGETVAKDALSPDTCRWCATNAIDRGVRLNLRWDDAALAKRLSDVTGFALTPLAAMGGLVVLSPDRRATALHDLVIVAEAAAIATDLNYLVKIAVARERPDVSDLAPADKPRTDRPAENNLSFNSGHATSAMAFAVAAGTTATLRGYRHAWAVWATGVPLALATGYLRIAGDRHWASDVVTGWAVGAAVGVAVPYLLHTRPGPGRPTVALGRAADATTLGLAVAW